MRCRFFSKKASSLISWSSTVRIMGCFHRGRRVFERLVYINIICINLFIRIFAYLFKFLLRHHFEECFEDNPRCKCDDEANWEVEEVGRLVLESGLDADKDED